MWIVIGILIKRSARWTALMAQSHKPVLLKVSFEKDQPGYPGGGLINPFFFSGTQFSFPLPPLLSGPAFHPSIRKPHGRSGIG